VVQAAATTALVGVTIWYVRLTREILRTSQAQLADSRALLDARLHVSRKQLRAILVKIEAIVRPLNPTQVPVDYFRRSGIWEISDEERVLQLAATLTSDAGEAAGRLVSSLSWLRQLQLNIDKIWQGHWHPQSSPQPELRSSPPRVVHQAHQKGCTCRESILVHIERSKWHDHKAFRVVGASCPISTVKCNTEHRGHSTPPGCDSPDVCAGGD